MGGSLSNELRPIAHTMLSHDVDNRQAVLVTIGSRLSDWKAIFSVAGRGTLCDSVLRGGALETRRVHYV
jgi:hypothetical protein